MICHLSGRQQIHNKGVSQLQGKTIDINWPRQADSLQVPDRLAYTLIWDFGAGEANFLRLGITTDQSGFL